jgi:hypothetical protein
MRLAFELALGICGSSSCFCDGRSDLAESDQCLSSSSFFRRQARQVAAFAVGELEPRPLALLFGTFVALAEIPDVS